MDFRRSIIASICLHLFLLLVGFITFPSIMPHQTEAIASILVDLISNEDMMAGAKHAAKAEAPQKRSKLVPIVQPDDVKPIEDKKPVEPKTTPDKPQETVTAPPEEKEKAPPPAAAEKKAEELDPDAMLKKIEEQKQQDEKKKQEDLKKEEAKKQADDKKKLAEEKKKADEQRLSKQAEKFDADKISNLLNKQEGAQAPKAESAEEKQASLGAEKGTGKKLTMSQRDLMAGMIEEQVRPCWSPPLNASDINDMVVVIKIAMNRDGSLSTQPRVINSDANSSFRAIADAAVRAIVRCAPLKLPAEWYDGEYGWSDITYRFPVSNF